jgi:DNA-binding SARP family transcriptional activator
VLSGEAGFYRLARGSGLTVDVEEFERLAGACEPALSDLARRPWSAESPRLAPAELARRRSRIAAAVAAYGGELLPELRYVQWAAAERERLRDRHHRLLVGLATLELAAGRAAEASALARRVLAEDALSEEAERLLLRALAARQEKSALIRSYRSFARRLARELDLAPSPETEALFRALAGDGGG